MRIRQQPLALTIASASPQQRTRPHAAGLTRKAVGRDRPRHHQRIGRRVNARVHGRLRRDMRAQRRLQQHGHRQAVRACERDNLRAFGSSDATGQRMQGAATAHAQSYGNRVSGDSGERVALKIEDQYAKHRTYYSGKLLMNDSELSLLTENSHDRFLKTNPPNSFFALIRAVKTTTSATLR